MEGCQGAVGPRLGPEEKYQVSSARFDSFGETITPITDHQSISLPNSNSISRKLNNPTVIYGTKIQKNKTHG